MRKPISLMAIGSGLAMMALIATLSVAALALSAQGQTDDNTPWTAYLVDSQTNDLLGVAADGSTTEYSLDIPAGSYINTFEMPITGDGLAGYCGMISPAAGGAQFPEATLRVRDLPAGTNQLALDLGNHMNCNAGPFGSGPNGEDVIAVSLLSRVPRMNADPGSTPIWRMDLVAINTGETVASLTSLDEAVDTIQLEQMMTGMDPATLPLMLHPISVAADAVRFQTLLAMGDGGPFELPIYEWNPQTGTITDTGEARNLSGNADQADGRIVSPIVDESLPQIETVGIGPAYNAITLIEADGTEQTIYQSDGLLVGAVTFANGGEAIAVTLLSAMTMGITEDTPITVILMDLDGNVIREVGAFNSYPQVTGTPDGLLVFEQTNANNTMTFSLTHHQADGTVTPIWEVNRNISTNGTMSFWQLATVVPSS